MIPKTVLKNGRSLIGKSDLSEIAIIGNIWISRIVDNSRYSGVERGTCLNKCLVTEPKSNLLQLRLPHRNDAKIAKICNLCTFWPVIQPISHLSKKDGLLTELQAKTARGCRLLLFQHHSYEVTLTSYNLKM